MEELPASALFGRIDDLEACSPKQQEPRKPSQASSSAANNFGPLLIYILTFALSTTPP
jgi:hypothetical protein